MYLKTNSKRVILIFYYIDKRNTSRERLVQIFCGGKWSDHRTLHCRKEEKVLVYKRWLSFDTVHNLAPGSLYQDSLFSIIIYDQLVTF